MDLVKQIANWLLIIGGLNWGLVGFFEYDLVAEIFGGGSGLARTIYALVGLSALVVLYGMMMKPEKKSE